MFRSIANDVTPSLPISASIVWYAPFSDSARSTRTTVYSGAPKRHSTRFDPARATTSTIGAITGTAVSIVHTASDTSLPELPAASLAVTRRIAWFVAGPVTFHA